MTGREVMRASRRQSEEHDERLAAIRARVQRSLADARRDVPLATVFDRLAKHDVDMLKSMDKSGSTKD